MRAPASLLGWLLPPATALVIVVGAVLLLMTPPWMHAALDLAGGSVPGGDRAAAQRISDETVGQLLSGGDFAVMLPDGSSMYTADEAAHLRDARAVLYLFLGLALIGALVVAGALVRRPGDARRWRAVARGGAALVIAVLGLGVIGLLAFDVALEMFHRIFFPGGNWAFPGDSNMIRLYPFAFWQVAAGSLGLLCVLGGGAAWSIGRRRAAQLTAGG